jgi:hypothetical protein
MRFAEWFRLEEMAARRSFAHSMGKWQQPVGKPIAILTAWRGPSHMLYPEAVRRQMNDEANRKLMTNIRSRGLSYYPVVGAAPETVYGMPIRNKENSFVVEPIGRMDNGTFIKNIQELLFNPTGEAGPGPFRHSQDAALVKLPGDPMAYSLEKPANLVPSGPHDYGYDSYWRHGGTEATERPLLNPVEIWTESEPDHD